MGYFDEDPTTSGSEIPPVTPPVLPKEPALEALPKDPALGTLPKEPGPVPAPTPAPGATAASQDVDTLSLDAIGDIPPPPVPPAPAGLAGAPGAATFARPGTLGARPFRSPAFASAARGPRFGPGVAITGGAPATVAGDEGGGDPLGLNPDDVGEMLRRLAGGM